MEKRDPHYFLNRTLKEPVSLPDEFILELFYWQAQHCDVYKEWLSHLKVVAEEIQEVDHIPFLPIQFFKTREVRSLPASENELVFQSSGTTGQVQSNHFIAYPGEYKLHARKLFEYFIGNLADHHFFMLLPSYLDNPRSSLVFMAQDFYQQSDQRFGGFYRTDYQKLLRDLDEARKKTQHKIVLLAVTFALWELIDMKADLSDAIILETGGMKGRGPERSKEELYDKLKHHCSANDIRSEYGMTELLSQAYSPSNTIGFEIPASMRVFVKPVEEPTRPGSLINRSGLIHLVDAMNVGSCSFLATEDIGRLEENGRLVVLGRSDGSEPRGCNMLMF